MVQQSTTEPRKTEKVTGPKTRQQQKAVVERRELTKGADVSAGQKPLSEARKDQERPAGEFEISTGDRSVKRGANQETEHHKNRTSD